VSRAIIAKRLHGLGFLKLWFVAAAAAIEKDGSVRSNLGARGVEVANRIIRSFQIDYNPATDDRLWASLDEAYVYVQRGETTAAKAEGRLAGTVEMVQPLVTQDIAEYAARKMAEAGARHGSRR
jgi:hypothetical protein